jgi:hypothetical protein
LPASAFALPAGIIASGFALSISKEEKQGLSHGNQSNNMVI